jgi:hypothetical protein
MATYEFGNRQPTASGYSFFSSDVCGQKWKTFYRFTHYFSLRVKIWG